MQVPLLWTSAIKRLISLILEVDYHVLLRCLIALWQVFEHLPQLGWFFICSSQKATCQWHLSANLKQQVLMGIDKLARTESRYHVLLCFLLEL